MDWTSSLDPAEALNRLEPYIRRTPLIRTRELSQVQGDDVYLKLETLQRSGSFKLRGATNAILKNRDRAEKQGVITASAGNHAQGVALGALQVGCPAVVIMPEATPGNKIQATEDLEAEVVLHGDTFEEANDHAHKLAEERGAMFVPPFDDPDVIEGQGTLGVELLQDQTDLEWILCPVGGGGLLAGIALSSRLRSSNVDLYAVQSGLGSSLKAALEAGEPVDISPPPTVAEGMATGRIGDHPFELLSAELTDVLEVDEESIVESILWCLERQRQVTEGAGAAPLAAWRNRHDQLDGPGALVISGGNLDSLELTNLVERGLRMAGRLLVFETQLPDQPGALLELSRIVAHQGGNIQSIKHDRSDRRVALRRAKVSLEIEVQSPEDGDELIQALESEGYPVVMQDDEESITPDASEPEGS